jgi:hypothetical protein
MEEMLGSSSWHVSSCPLAEIVFCFYSSLSLFPFPLVTPVCLKLFYSVRKKNYRVCLTRSAAAADKPIEIQKRPCGGRRQRRQKKEETENEAKHAGAGVNTSKAQAKTIRFLTVATKRPTLCLQIHETEKNGRNVAKHCAVPLRSSS